MSIPAPLTPPAATITIEGIHALRIVECALALHEEAVELVPSRSSTDRLPLPTRRWLEATLTVVAAGELQALALIGQQFSCAITVGDSAVDAPVAAVTGYRFTLGPDGGREVITLRISRWTLGEP
ncbi:MAG TPA: hypothetical protein VEI97_14275 [bacterium]|nr:hypothetical protein [bacterium]